MSLVITRGDFELTLAEFSILCGAISVAPPYRRWGSSRTEEVGSYFLEDWPGRAGKRSVYFATVDSAVKIGVSDSPQKRIVELNGRTEKRFRPPGVGGGEACIALEVTGCSGQHERWLHSLLRRDMILKSGKVSVWRRETEWFRGSAVRTLLSMARSRAVRSVAA